VPDTISDSAHGKPLPVATDDAARDDMPWLNIFTPEERAIIRQCDCLIWPDRPITRRLTRHVLTTKGGHRLQALKTLDECWEYAQAQDWATVGIMVCGRAILASAPLTLTPPSDPNQMGLFDTAK